ncbi:heat shock protein beta-1-like [Xyrauchen texanus]|uniref:heat shock protein beta-1-like n=1 Tax=Xyrauchen texanus TaxID=154827 RepID=UPI0022427BC5|nr:heat shock protein beta-1-like [Xyrauchen texanus]
MASLCQTPPCFLEPDEDSWIDSARKQLDTSTWPGSMYVPLSKGQVYDAVCEQKKKGQQNWKVCLNVNPISLEISIKTKEGYLEIMGKCICKEKRQENHGSVSRSFTRKYKLPVDFDLKQISSMLSPDGTLSIEAPLPGSNLSLPEEIVIPIHIIIYLQSNS